MRSEIGVVRPEMTVRVEITRFFDGKPQDLDVEGDFLEEHRDLGGKGTTWVRQVKRRPWWDMLSRA